MTYLVDSHCHLDQLKRAEGETVNDYLDGARMAGVQRFLNVSISRDNIATVAAIAADHDEVFATAGIHPNSEESEEPTVDELVAWAQHPKVIAIGETGLDYYHTEQQPPHALQQQRFRHHIAAARAVNKPLIIHCREARHDTLRILAEEGAEAVGGIMHCFVEDLATAEAALALGFYISISGIVTFKSAHALQQVVTQLPLDRLLVETDSPYLAPIPHRGRQNQPRFVTHVADKVADLQQCPVEAVIEATTANFNALFGLAP